MVDDGKPYVVALNFGYDREGDDLILYLHSAMEGKKIDILKKIQQCIFKWIV
jgi:nitroimidazol reductase NimA-like FMN-containing flavoprotein (pyridoxamine 5'-phosphate oxidase superfamily)